MELGEKHFDGEMRDFDNDSYDSVVVPEAKKEEPKVEESKSEEKPVEVDLLVIDGKSLLAYFMRRFKETHGYEYKADWIKEVAIFKAFKERYGVDAGPMVELLFDKHAGKFNGGVVTVTAFSRGAKWIQDKLYVELQQKSRVEAQGEVRVEGLMNSNEFLGKFSALGS